MRRHPQKIAVYWFVDSAKAEIVVEESHFMDTANVYCVVVGAHSCDSGRSNQDVIREVRRSVQRGTVSWGGSFPRGMVKEVMH